MLAISAATAITAPASAAPIIIRDTVTSPIFETGVPHDCRDLTGTIVGTDVVSFQSVETDQGFHIEGTTEDTARIDWSDGSFALVHSVDHFSFNVVGHDTTVFTEAHTDSVTSSRLPDCSSSRTRSVRSITSRSPTASSGSICKRGTSFFGDC